MPRPYGRGIKQYIQICFRPCNAANATKHVTHVQPANTPIPGPTPLYTPSSISSRTFVQLHYKVPNGCNGTPHVHPQNCHFPLSEIHPSNTLISRPPQRSTLNGIIQSAVFLQFTHRTDPHTYRPTDGQDDKPLLVNTRLHYIVLIDSDAANDMGYSPVNEQSR